MSETCLHQDIRDKCLLSCFKVTINDIDKLKKKNKNFNFLRSTLIDSNSYRLWKLLWQWALRPLFAKTLSEADVPSLDSSRSRCLPPPLLDQRWYHLRKRCRAVLRDKCGHTGKCVTGHLPFFPQGENVPHPSFFVRVLYESHYVKPALGWVVFERTSILEDRLR